MLSNKTILQVVAIFVTTFYSLCCYSQGIYHPAATQLGTHAIHKDSSVFIGWGYHAEIFRGYQDISDTSLGKTTVGIPEYATQQADGNVVSLGDGGYAIITFDRPIADLNGPDFAVFENSFSDDFLELAFVEVSSDGVNFFRFKSHSLTQDTSQTPSFGFTDPTNLNNLAGKYRGQYGTPFDLAELKNTSGLDINNITQVKIIDVVGSISPQYANFDSYGNAINDPWPTDFPNGGFDLDAVGIIHSSWTNSTEEFEQNQVIIYPNPFANFLTVLSLEKNKFITQIQDINGKIILETNTNERQTINTKNWENGIYILTVQFENEIITKKIIK